MKDPLQIPVCRHDKPVSWSAVIITRWSDERKGHIRHLIPAPYCEACAASLTAEDFLTDGIWKHINNALIESGHGPQSRKMARIEWTRTAEVRREFEELKQDAQLFYPVKRT